MRIYFPIDCKAFLFPRNMKIIGQHIFLVCCWGGGGRRGGKEVKKDKVLGGGEGGNKMNLLDLFTEQRTSGITSLSDFS